MGKKAGLYAECGSAATGCTMPRRVHCEGGEGSAVRAVAKLASDGGPDSSIIASISHPSSSSNHGATCKVDPSIAGLASVLTGLLTALTRPLHPVRYSLRRLRLLCRLCITLRQCCITRS